MTGWPLQTGPLAKEKEEEDNIWRRKIFGPWRRRKTRKEKKENIWRKIRFCQWRRGNTVRENDKIKMF